PAGVYITHRATKEVYKFLNAEENVMVHYREGFHSHNKEDIEILVNVIRHMQGREALNEKINVSPFEELPLGYQWKCP
ncbi:MAG: hypothetical protein IJC48_09585, partial [Clostridia bacterium]|nr:hypothetical protein [Clostridia bacterium]